MAKRVDFINQVQDLRALVLGSLGFSTGYICGQTGLRSGQVLYRLQKGGIKRLDYRNGTSPAANEVMTMASKRLALEIKDRLLRINRKRSA